MPTIASSPLLHSRRRAHTQQLLLVSGLLSSIVYVVANIAAGLAWHGYSFASQAVSELSAIDAPSRAVWMPLGVLYDLLLIAFGIGVWRVASEKRALRASAAMLIAIGVLGFLWPPMHMRGTVTTLTDTLHVVFAAVVSLLTMLSIGLGAIAAGRTFRIFSVATLAMLVVFGTLSFLAAPGIGTNEPTPWLGLYERINIGGYLLWVAVLSIALGRQSSSSMSESAPL